MEEVKYCPPPYYREERRMKICPRVGVTCSKNGHAQKQKMGRDVDNHEDLVGREDSNEKGSMASHTLCFDSK